MAEGAGVPVTVKIRLFPELERTLEYARMLEAAGAQLIAVHGRTREQKDSSACRADWNAIRVRQPIGKSSSLSLAAICGDRQERAA